VLAGAAIFIVVDGAQSAGYHIRGGTMAAVWVLGGLILAVVVATLAFAGRQVRQPEFGGYPEAERRPAAPPPMAPPPPAPMPMPTPQQAPPMPPQVVANATEAAATLTAATRTANAQTSISDEGVDLQVIFAQLVRRLLTLVLQQINRLDELENEVEDPKLLKSLFGIDHQATQVRRYGENIGVLVGALPQRQWTHPVPVTVAQRSAVSETPDYPRVQVIPRAPGRIHGHAVSDVIHILSELVENATNYSNPSTKVTVGAHRVSAGLAIEVNDHGIGMEPDQFQRLNILLRDPSGANVRDLLSQGRIGLSVVAKMAQRHGIAVELQPNVTGGTLALVVIPDALLAPEELPADKNRQTRRGMDTTQLPARPALVPPPDAVPQVSRSAAALSPVAAATPPLPAPATTQVPPLPSAAPAQVPAHAVAEPTHMPTQMPMPMPMPAHAAMAEAPRPAQPLPVRAPMPAHSVAAQPVPAQPTQVQASPVRSVPAEPQWPSMSPSPVAPPAAAPRHSAPGTPVPPQSADQYRGTGAPAPQPQPRYGEPQAPEPGNGPGNGPGTGLLPDGRPQLRRRTPQGHISARLIQADAQQTTHGTGALSPTMMSDFWQGLSAGTAPADPPAAGTDLTQHDRTTANRQEWNQ
jgi:hypothetical protein